VRAPHLFYYRVGFYKTNDGHVILRKWQRKNKKEQIAATDATMEIKINKSNITCLSTSNIAETQKKKSTKNLETSSSLPRKRLQVTLF
jgi:hypothetical protein